MWFLIAMPVQAEQSVSLQTSFNTFHINKKAGWIYNENNKMFALELKRDRTYYTVTTYDNTRYKRSVSMGIGYNAYNSKYVELDGLTGLVSGYGNLKVYLAPRVTFKYGLTKRLSVKTSTTMFGKAVISTAGFEYKF